MADCSDAGRKPALIPRGFHRWQQSQLSGVKRLRLQRDEQRNGKMLRRRLRFCGQDTRLEDETSSYYGNVSLWDSSRAWVSSNTLLLFWESSGRFPGLFTRGVVKEIVVFSILYDISY